MQITAPHPEHVDALYALYRDAVHAAPHCRFVPHLARFHAELLGRAAPPPVFVPPHAQRLFAAVDDGTARGICGVYDLYGLGWSGAPGDDGAVLRQRRCRAGADRCL